MVSASVTFLGAEPLEVLRFGPDSFGVVRYATVGISRRPMHPTTAAVADPLRGPRAELVLTLRPGRDQVLRALAVLAATPAVDGIVLAAGVTVDLQSPLWPGAALSAVLLAEPGDPTTVASARPDLQPDPRLECVPVPDLDLVAAGALAEVDGIQPVRFYPVLPMTAAEAALARARGSGLIRQRWREADTDLQDPDRRGVRVI